MLDISYLCSSIFSSKKRLVMLVRYAGRYRPAQVRFRLADPSHALSASSSNFVFKRPNFGFRETDRRTDRRNKHIPSWKLSSEQRMQNIARPHRGLLKSYRRDGQTVGLQSFSCLSCRIFNWGGVFCKSFCDGVKNKINVGWLTQYNQTWADSTLQNHFNKELRQIKWKRRVKYSFDRVSEKCRAAYHSRSYSRGLK